MTGSELKAIRHALSLSQYELAHLLGLERNSIGRWESRALPVPELAAREIRRIQADASPIDTAEPMV